MSITFNQICINEEMMPIYIYLYIYPIGVEVECSPMARETDIQSQVESYQKLKKKKKNGILFLLA